MKIGNLMPILTESHPARGAWIEIEKKKETALYKLVAPRKGRVD